jgi:hypothetical protein
VITDTDEATRVIQLAATRRLGPSERVRVAAEMSEAARRIAIESERRRHPGLTQQQARDIVFRRLWGPELAKRVPVALSRER